MGEGSVVAVQLGLLIMAAAGLFGAGVAWAALTGRLRRSEERHDELAGDVDMLERSIHKGRSDRQQLDLRIALLEQKQGVPTVHLQDRTDPIELPRRTRTRTGGYGPMRPPSESG